MFEIPFLRPNLVKKNNFLLTMRRLRQPESILIMDP